MKGLFVLLGVVVVLSFSTAELTEIFNVNGCQKSLERSKEAFGCFHRNESSLSITVQGLNFPSDISSLRLRLIETSIAVLQWGKEDRNTTAGPNTRSLLTLDCTDMESSEQFPGQLLSCRLQNPLLSLDTLGDPTEAQNRLRKGPVWMDVVLERRDADGDSYTPIAFLRESVEITIPTASDNASSPVEHPMERLYGSSKQSEEDDRFWLSLGIGGLKDQLRSLFRRVFLSRLPSIVELADTLELQHVRGVILHGPPGNGKTLIARALHKLLGGNTKLTIVNAPDIISKYVGDSEKNLRDLFEGLEMGTSVKEEGGFGGGGGGRSTDTPSGKGLHILVIDEFESLFRKRGFSEDESSAKAVYDGVTNTLLSLMDGVKVRNDILVIGLTNQLSALDSALLRPGRFEVIMEVPSPDLSAREDIFFIHTEKLREKKFLGSDVNLPKLARVTDGFSGADISGAVRAAVSYALLRHREQRMLGSFCDPSSATDCQESPLHSEFLVKEQDLQRAVVDISRTRQNTVSSGIHPLSEIEAPSPYLYLSEDAVKSVGEIKAVVDGIVKSKRRESGLLLLTGSVGNGKTELARYLVHEFSATFTTLRYISCRRLLDTPNKLENSLKSIRQAFVEATDSENALIVLDDIDYLVNSVDRRNTWSAALRNYIASYLENPSLLTSDKGVPELSLPEEEEEEAHKKAKKRLLILTSSEGNIETFNHFSFDYTLPVRGLDRTAMMAVLDFYRVTPTHLVKEGASNSLFNAYPPSLSFKLFLRVTDAAIQYASTNINASIPTFFATEKSMLKAEKTLTEVKGSSEDYFVKDKSTAVALADSVRKVLHQMGLSKQGFSVLNSDGDELLW